MRFELVRHGDETTTGGFVMAYSSRMHDGGRKIALSGDEATCGNCKGAYKILGTGKGVSDRSRVVVVHGDRVLCPCGKNRVIAGGDARCHMEQQSEASFASLGNASNRASAPSSDLLFDEQIRSDADGAAMEGYPYFIETEDGRTFSGRLEPDGRLPRITSDTSGQYSVHWGDDALARQQGI